MNINKEFWAEWKKGNVEQALQMPILVEQKPKNRLQTMLFGSVNQMKQTGMISGLSSMEFLYDLLMIQPEVVKGLDFARTEDLSQLFTLSQFASNVDTSTLTGDMAQLQGYVAEQMLAIELQSKGYDIEFPTTSNNAGWDILIDGQPFQVKNLASPEGVREHLEKYPDIPVYVNEELAPYFEGNPNVYISTVSREEVLEATKSTINHADDLLNFELPILTVGVSSAMNLRRVINDDVTMNQAMINVVSDTASKVALGALGQKAGVVVGGIFFGPAGSLMGAIVGAVAGTSQGGNLSTKIRSVLAKKEEQVYYDTIIRLIEKVIERMDNKHTVRINKKQLLVTSIAPTKVNEIIVSSFTNQFQKNEQYMMNKKDELLSIREQLKNREVDGLYYLPTILKIIIKTGVHPYHYQKELNNVRDTSIALHKKL